MEKIIHSNDSELNIDSAKNLVLLDSITETSHINSQKFTKIISLDYITHKTLSKKKIQHTLSDDYISKSEKENLFDYIVSCSGWYEKIPGSKNLEFENVNILGLFNQLEFHVAFLDIIIKAYTIANIIKTEKPNKIFISSNLKNYVEQFIDQKMIDVLVSNNKIEQGFVAEQIEIRFNIFSKPITLYLPKKLYNKLKNIQESIIGTLFNLWYKPDTSKPNLILEFNPALFSPLFSELRKSKHPTILLNQRRTAVWSWKSIQNLRKNGCKIIDQNKFFDMDSQTFGDLKTRYSLELKKFWQNDTELKNFFSKDNIQFWPVMKEKLETMYQVRLENYLKLILISKNILNSLSPNCILSLNEHGETEKIFHMLNHKIPNVLLQHSFLRYYEHLYDLQSRYEYELMYGLKSNYFLVWGQTDLDFYSKFGIPKEKLIITGSPKHEPYFQSAKLVNKSEQRIILLAISPITNESGLCDVASFLNYEKLIEKILKFLKPIKNIKIIIKLHPAENFHNLMLNKYLKVHHPDITIFQTKFSKNLIESSDVLIHTSPEFYEMSTIMLEGMILMKPVIDIHLNDIGEKIQPSEGGIFRLDFKDDFTKIYKIIIGDDNYLVENIPKQLEKYLSNTQNASKKVSEFINTVNLHDK